LEKRRFSSVRLKVIQPPKLYGTLEMAKKLAKRTGRYIFFLFSSNIIIFFSRITITNLTQDNLLRSEIEISEVKMEDVGRAHVVANNFLAEVKLGPHFL